MKRKKKNSLPKLHLHEALFEAFFSFFLFFFYGKLSKELVDRQIHYPFS